MALQSWQNFILAEQIKDQEVVLNFTLKQTSSVNDQAATYYWSRDNSSHQSAKTKKYSTSVCQFTHYIGTPILNIND